MHRSGHVCDPRASEGGHREGLPGSRQQGHQVVRKVLGDAALHDLQLIFIIVLYVTVKAMNLFLFQLGHLCGVISGRKVLIKKANSLL